MEKGWEEVFITVHEYKANLAKGILESNNIKAVVLNQQDSAYKSFGDFVVYVEEENKTKAEELLSELKS